MSICLSDSVAGSDSMRGRGLLFRLPRRCGRSPISVRTVGMRYFEMKRASLQLTQIAVRACEGYRLFQAARVRALRWKDRWSGAAGS
jgi:hypothetical protein